MIDPFTQSLERLGISTKTLLVAHELMETWVRQDEVPASGFVVGRYDRMTDPWFAGRRWADRGAPPLRHDALFLAASLTKPVTAVATMRLVERGLLTLDDTVASVLPEFAQNGKAEVRIRHLLTHTSGLPDQLPNNERLRAGHAPLSAFVEETCRQPLLFAPGTSVRYQSAGFTILGELVFRLTNQSLPDYLQAELFTPLGMADTSLGWNLDRRDRQTLIRIEPSQAHSDWNWNSSYWLGLGSPWGGLVTSPSDYGRFLQMMLGEGRLGEVRILSPSTVRAMIANQLDGYPEIPEVDRRLRPWGLGWRLHWPGTSAYFGDLLGPRSFGHWGATGTLAWADPDRDAFAVIMTSQPPGDQGSYLARLSNILASAFD